MKSELRVRLTETVCRQENHMVVQTDRLLVALLGLNREVLRDVQFWGIGEEGMIGHHSEVINGASINVQPCRTRGTVQNDAPSEKPATVDTNLALVLRRSLKDDAGEVLPYTSWPEVSLREPRLPEPTRRSSEPAPTRIFHSIFTPLRTLLKWPWSKLLNLSDLDSSP